MLRQSGIDGAHASLDVQQVGVGLLAQMAQASAPLVILKNMEDDPVGVRPVDGAWFQPTTSPFGDDFTSTTGPAIARDDPQLMYIKLTSGIITVRGIYRSTDGGDTWTQMESDSAGGFTDFWYRQIATGGGR